MVTETHSYLRLYWDVLWQELSKSNILRVTVKNKLYVQTMWCPSHFTIQQRPNINTVKDFFWSQQLSQPVPSPRYQTLPLTPYPAQTTFYPLLQNPICQNNGQKPFFCTLPRDILCSSLSPSSRHPKPSPHTSDSWPCNKTWCIRKLQKPAIDHWCLWSQKRVCYTHVLKDHLNCVSPRSL